MGGAAGGRANPARYKLGGYVWRFLRWSTCFRTSLQKSRMLIEQQRKAVETNDLAVRLELLEQQKGGEY